MTTKHVSERVKFKRKISVAGVMLLVAFAPRSTVSAGESPAILDAIAFGNIPSEKNHNFNPERSEVIRGGLGEPARRLLPPTTNYFEGGRMAFTLQVDPAKNNYATVRFWGDDTSDDRLMLFCEGKQIGYRHLGDIDILDFGDDSGEPACNGRFFYNTLPLPFLLTRGKTELHFEVRSTGPTWSYGTTFAQYQKPMTAPTRGIYKIYTHTNGFFAPPADEKQGAAPQNPPVRNEPGAEVLDQLKVRVNRELNGLLNSAKPLNEMQMQFLAKAFFVKWSAAFQNQKAVAQTVSGLDALFAAWRENPGLAQHDAATWNPGWFEFGPAGNAIFLLAEPLQPFLDEPLDAGGKKISRRAAWSEMLQAARDWHRHHRRLYSNQTMIIDLYGIYLSNRGIEVVDPTNALAETAARRYLYESLALEPWRDSDQDGDEGSDRENWGVGTNYWELTQKGLTRELGFAGYYGEVLDWVTQIYDATRPAPGQPGDEKIKAQLEKIEQARAVFRYPAPDADGHRAMRCETIIGWRDAHYPGGVCYNERVSWDGSTLFSAAATLDSKSIGCAQQMFDDNQFFKSVKDQMRESNFRVTASLLGIPGQYEVLQAQPPGEFRLPMTPGQPDFVFTDEEDGVVALKNGDDILYVSLYWRARYAVNFLARIHYVTPRLDRIADVQEDVDFEPSGLTYTRPDWINFDFGDGGPKYPVELHSAHAGEKLPIAKIPAGIKFRPGDENVYAGKGSFYTLRYGNYLIGMNLTQDKTFELKPPPGVSTARELAAGKMLELAAPVKVGPRSTMVLWLANH